MSHTEHSQLTRAELRSDTDTDKLNIGSQVAREEREEREDNNNNINNLELAIISLSHSFCLSEELKGLKGFIRFYVILLNIECQTVF